MFPESLLQSLNQKLDAVSGSLPFLLPEIFLTIWLFVLILTDLIFRNRKFGFHLSLTLCGYLLVALAICWQASNFLTTHQRVFLFGKILQLYPGIIFFKSLFILCGIFTALISFKAKIFENTDEQKPITEYFTFLTAILLGLHLLVMSNNLLMLYLSLELVSIPSYILTAFYFNKKSAEGSIKYLLFGAMSSGLMLYGMSLIYGLTGTLEIAAIGNYGQAPEINQLAVYTAFLLSIAGLLFKISAIPFHLWTPDVYEAAPTPVVAFFSTAPKAAGLLVLIIMSSYFSLNLVEQSPENPVLQNIIGFLALAGILLGNFSALWQNNIKRLLAYSAIAHTGFMLIALTVSGQFAMQSLLFYLSVYIFMNFGAFLWIEMMANNLREKVENPYDIRNYQGLGLSYPLMGILILVIMIALTGLPPTVGFTAKLFIFSALWEAIQVGKNPLLLYIFIFGLLNTAIALFYYLKVPFYLFFRKGNLAVSGKWHIWDVTLLIGFTIPLLVLFFKPDWLMGLIRLFL